MSGAWVSRKEDLNQWLQVDFLRNVKMTKVAIQGRKDYNQWTKKFKLTFGIDGSSAFQTYQENGVDKVKTGLTYPVEGRNSHLP